jgi:Glycosyl transferase family 2
LSRRFAIFEIIVCDNSDADSVRTAEAVEAFRDPRLRYVRTTGDLSMPDNWERAIADATGEFVGVLTDRSVFRPDALAVAHPRSRGLGRSASRGFLIFTGENARAPTLSAGNAR